LYQKLADPGPISAFCRRYKSRGPVGNRKILQSSAQVCSVVSVSTTVTKPGNFVCQSLICGNMQFVTEYIYGTYITLFIKILI